MCVLEWWLCMYMWWLCWWGYTLLYGTLANTLCTHSTYIHPPPHTHPPPRTHSGGIQCALTAAHPHPTNRLPTTTRTRTRQCRRHTHAMHAALCRHRHTATPRRHTAPRAGAHGAHRAQRAQHACSYTGLRHCATATQGVVCMVCEQGGV